MTKITICDKCKKEHKLIYSFYEYEGRFKGFDLCYYCTKELLKR